MADLKETDEPVEKASKKFRGVRISSKQRRNIAGGKLDDYSRSNDGKTVMVFGRDRKIGRGLSAKRPTFVPRLRKSSDPLTTLYAEIEKARGLLPKGGSGRLRERLRVGSNKDHANRFKSPGAMKRWSARYEGGKPNSRANRVDSYLRNRSQRPSNRK